MSVEGQFFLSVTGSIEHAEFYDADNAYCKYGFHFGPEWSVVAGIEEGLTQMCKRSNDARNLIVWNFPLEITLKSTNPHGWPQLIMSIYGLDMFDHDVIEGYGVCHLPLTTGHHEKKVSVYVPQSSSTLQQFAAWLTGKRPELIDPAILASGGGRELTRMKVQGHVTLTFNVVLKDFLKLDYDNEESFSDSKPLIVVGYNDDIDNGGSCRDSMELNEIVVRLVETTLSGRSLSHLSHLLLVSMYVPVFRLHVPTCVSETCE